MPEAIINGAKIFYEVHGDGFPLVLTHGLGSDHTMWMPQVRELKKKYKVIIWDVRGHGRSEVTEEGYSIGQFVDDLRGLLARLGVERSHIGGLSMGGWITWSFALKHPDVTASVLLSDSAGLLSGMTDKEREDKEKMFRASAAVAMQKGRAPLADVTLSLMFSPGFIKENGKLLALTRQRLQEDPGIGFARTVLKAFPAYWNSSPEETIALLNQINKPALVIAGDVDVLTPLPSQKALAAAIPGARFEVIKGAGHVPNLEQPELWNRLALEFLDSVKV